MRVLVTNDDGIEAPGLAALARALDGDGHDVLVVAPFEDRSGSGAGVGPVHLGGGTDYEERVIESLEGVPAFAIDGLPALAVMLSCLDAFGPRPDLVASGINMGFNRGRSVLHSGTVGAALTAANFGVSGLAASAEAADTMDWSAAATLATLLAGRLEGEPAGTVVSLNVPARPIDELLGLRRAKLALGGTVQSTVVEDGGRFQIRFDPPGVRPAPDTDVALTEAGYATISPLGPISDPPGAETGRTLERLLEIWPTEGLAS